MSARPLNFLDREVARWQLPGNPTLPYHAIPNHTTPGLAPPNRTTPQEIKTYLVSKIKPFFHPRVKSGQ